MNKHIISIIIPTFNRAHLISETLDSIIAQTYTNWECIVVDDGSTDDNEKVLQEYILKDERFQYYQRPDLKPKGACSFRNYGFSLSKGEYVNWFDDDDIMHYDFLQSKLSKFKYCDVDEMSEKMMLVLGNIDFYKTMGAEGRRNIRENFTKDVHIDIINKAIKSP
jgi:glycosyltransferase involved in cell wall biosynthesis